MFRHFLNNDSIVCKQQQDGWKKLSFFPFSLDHKEKDLRYIPPKLCFYFAVDDHHRAHSQYYLYDDCLESKPAPQAVLTQITCVGYVSSTVQPASHWEHCIPRRETGKKYPASSETAKFVLRQVMLCSCTGDISATGYLFTSSLLQNEVRTILCFYPYVGHVLRGKT